MTTYQYSHSHLVSACVYYDIAGGVYDKTQYGYENDGNPASGSSPAWMGRRNETISPAGIITYLVFDAQGDVTSTYVGTNAYGATDINPQGSSAPNNMVETSSSTFDADGNMLVTTQYVAGQANREAQLGNDWRDRQVWAMTYDGTRYTYSFATYDNLDEAVSNQVFQAATAWQTNAVDLLLSQTDTAYDSLGQVYRTTQYASIANNLPATPEVTNYWHDAAGNQVKLQDPDTNQTTWQVDAFGHAIQQTNPLGTSHYAFDAAGELVQSTDANGRPIVFRYNGVGQKTEEDWYNPVDGGGNPVGPPTEIISFAYNAAGLMQSASDQNTAAGTTATDTYGYDTEGHVTSETQQIPGLAPSVTYSERYSDGNRQELDGYVNGAYVLANSYQYAFNPSNNLYGQMSQASQWGAGGTEAWVDFTYFGDGQFKTVTRSQLDPPSYSGTSATWVTAAYGYSAAGQLASLAYVNEHGAALDAYSYTYTAAGDMNTSANTFDGTVTYTSDATGQLKNASGSTPPNESYTYTANGNRITTNNGTVTYVLGPDNEVLFDGTYNYQYDADGNQIARWVGGGSLPQPGDSDITIYTWDNRNRLASVTHYGSYGGAADLSINYLYDAFNRWIGQTVTTGSGGGATVAQTRFAYDGYQIAMQFDGAGTAALTAANLSHRYLWGPGVNQLLADAQSQPAGGGTYNQSLPGTVVWALGDHLNTVRELAVFDPTANGGNGATVIANHRVFSAFGQMLSQTNPVTLNPAAVDCIFGYTGEPMSRFGKNAATGAVSGIQNNLNRWYDAALGRWLSQDPDGLGPDVNPYRYCGNSATNYVDPSGMATVGAGITGDLAAFLGVSGSAQLTLSVNGCNPLDWRLGLMYSAGAGVITNYEAQVGVVTTFSTAARPEQFNGVSATVGGAATFGIGSVGVDVGNLNPEDMACGRQAPVTISPHLTIGPGVPDPNATLIVGPTIAKLLAAGRMERI